MIIDNFDHYFMRIDLPYFASSPKFEENFENQNKIFSKKFAKITNIFDYLIISQKPPLVIKRIHSETPSPRVDDYVILYVKDALFGEKNEYTVLSFCLPEIYTKYK